MIFFEQFRKSKFGVILLLLLIITIITHAFIHLMSGEIGIKCYCKHKACCRMKGGLSCLLLPTIVPDTGQKALLLSDHLTNLPAENSLRTPLLMVCMTWALALSPNSVSLPSCVPQSHGPPLRSLCGQCSLCRRTLASAVPTAQNTFPLTPQPV